MLLSRGRCGSSGGSPVIKRTVSGSRYAATMPVTHRKPGTKKSQAKTVPAVKGAPSTKSWTSNMDWLRRQPVWIILAVASGTCAAINGVFAKL